MIVWEKEKEREQEQEVSGNTMETLENKYGSFLAPYLPLNKNWPFVKPYTSLALSVQRPSPYENV